MILDTLDRSPLYHAIHPAFPAAFGWLASLDSRVPDGRHEIGGPSLVAIVQRYETAPPASKPWETHRLHGDIQYLVSGDELIGQAPRASLTVSQPYDPERDAEFYEPPAMCPSYLHLEAGMWAVFFPQDAHQPGVMNGTSKPVMKVVVKFRL
jgi:YhcH/YjgK/YiaL family protein